MTKDKRRSRSWIWFFATLGVLSVAAIAIVRIYSSHPQLTLEELKEAQALWRQRGPSDYDMEYTVKKNSPADTESFVVHVRNKKVVSATRNGQPLEERLYHYQDMGALFGFIEEFLRKDTDEAQPDRPRVYARAWFDPEDGHVLHYVRSVLDKRAGREGIEMTVKLHVIAATTGHDSSSETARGGDAGKR